MHPEALFQDTVNEATALATRIIAGVNRGAGNVVSQAEAVGRQVASTFAITARSAQALGTTILGSAIDTLQTIFTRARVQLLAVGQTLLSGLLQARGAVASGVVTLVTRLLQGAAVPAGIAINIGRNILAFIAGIIGGVLSVGAYAVGLGGRNVAGVVLGLVFGLFAALQVIVDRAVRGAAAVVLGVIYGTVAAIGTVAQTIWTAIVGVTRRLAAAIMQVINLTLEIIEGLGEAIGAAGPVGLAIAAALGAVLLGVVSRMISATSALLTTVATFIWNAVPVVIAFVGQMLARAWTIAGQVATQAWALAWNGIQTAFHAFGAALHTAIDTLASWASTAWTWVSGLARHAWGWVSGEIAPLVTSIGSLVGTITTFALALGRVLLVGAFVGVLAKGLFEAAKAATEFAQNAKLFSAQSGLRLGSSATILNRFGVQGISPDSTTQALGGQNSWIFGLKSRAFGLPDYQSPGFIEALARRFQGMSSQGPIGSIMAQSMMRSLGLGSSEFLKLANTSPTVLRANAAYGRQIDSNLGLTPGQLSKYADEILASLSRIGYAFEKIKLTLAGEFLPVIETVLGAITKTIGANAGRIRGLIESAAKWVFSSLPIIFMDSVVTLTTMVANGVHNLLDWSTWIVTKLPDVLANGATRVSETLRSWGASISQFIINTTDLIANGLVDVGRLIAGWIVNVGSVVVRGLSNLASFVQSMWSGSGQHNVLRDMAQWVAGAFDTMANAARDFVGNIAGVAQGLRNVILALSPFIAHQLGISGPIQTPQAAYAQAVAGMPVSNTLGTVNRFFAGPTLPRTANNIQNQANALQQNLNNMANNAMYQFGNLAYRTRMLGLNAAQHVVNGANSVADSIASPDGRHNVGRDIGDRIAEKVKPTMDLLGKIAPKMDSLSNAAQMYRQSLGSEAERRDRWDELIAATNKVSDTIREEARRDIGSGHLGEGLDMISAYMLKSLAQETARGVRAYGGS